MINNNKANEMNKTNTSNTHNKINTSSTSKINNTNKDTNNLFNKDYNHTEWIILCDSIINFSLVFGAIINLIIFARET